MPVSKSTVFGIIGLIFLILWFGWIATNIYEDEKIFDDNFNKYGYRYQSQINEFEKCKEFCGSNDVLFEPSKKFSQMLCECKKPWRIKNESKNI